MCPTCHILRRTKTVEYCRYQLTELNLITVGKNQAQSEKCDDDDDDDDSNKVLGRGTLSSKNINILKDKERLWKCSRLKLAKEITMKIILDPRLVLCWRGNVINYWIS